MCTGPGPGLDPAGSGKINMLCGDGVLKGLNKGKNMGKEWSDVGGTKGPVGRGPLSIVDRSLDTSREVSGESSLRPEFRDHGQ